MRLYLEPCGCGRACKKPGNRRGQECHNDGYDCDGWRGDDHEPFLPLLGTEKPTPLRWTVGEVLWADTTFGPVGACWLVAPASRTSSILISFAEIGNSSMRYTGPFRCAPDNGRARCSNSEGGAHCAGGWADTANVAPTAGDCGEVPAPTPYLFALGCRLELEELEKLADLVLLLGGVPHRRYPVDRVPVTPSDSLALHVTRLDEVAEYPLRCSLGDADALGHVPHPHVRVAGETEQHLRVTCQERPRLLILT
jgi:hypothetical protein